MSGDGARGEPPVSGRGPLPRLLPRSLAPAGTLTGDWLRGRDPAAGLLHGGAGPGKGGGRLGADDLGASSPEAAHRLERALAGEGVVVTTGQQPLLFLGPLFVLYKALTALEAARRITESGTPAVALFWVAGDDHDWPEVGRCRLLDTENELRTLRLEPPPGREGRAVGPTALPEGIEGLIEEMGQYLPDSEFVGDYLDLCREAWRPGRPLAEAFAVTLEGVLEGEDFAWLDASSPPVRRAAGPLLRRVVGDAGAVERRIRSGAERVREAGYDVQMPPREGALPVFADTPEGRTRLVRRDGGRISVGTSGEPVEPAEMQARMGERPERFSPSGALRPVLASWLLPVRRTVLGPSEVAYWAQLRPLFEWADVGMPEVRARRAWTVVEGKVEKVLDKLGADPGDVRDGGGALADRVTRQGRPQAVDDALEDARRETGRALDRVEEAVAGELPGIRSAVGAARHGAFEALSELEDAVDDRVRERHDVLLRQIRKAAAHLYPDGEPQERVLSPLYHLSRYGPDFVELVARATRHGLGADAPDAADG